MIKRELEDSVVRLSTQYPVITLTGPRQSGKTTLCRKIFPHYPYINLENLHDRERSQKDPINFLKEFSEGVILDEIQRVPSLTSYIQGIVDEKNKPGHFILTGSQQFEVTQSIQQSLAGRTAVLKLLPFSYSELYSGIEKAQRLPLPSLEDILYQGFYPRIHDQKLNPTEALSFYVSTYLERDLFSFIQVKDISLFERFIKIIATHVGQLVNYSQISNDCGVDQKTVKAWISILEASYIVFQLQPHFNNLKKRITKSPKIYFYDVGLAAYLLGITSVEHVKAHPLRGALFENFVIADMLKSRFHHVKDNNLYFFRDHVGHEVDVIIDEGALRRPGEIKSSSTFQSALLGHLKFYQDLDSQHHVSPFLVYGGDTSFQFQGVDVVSFRDLPQLKI